MLYLKNLFAPALIVLLTAQCMAQDRVPAPPSYKIIAAGTEYKKTGFYQWLWGRNRRKEWITPVKVPIVNFDTLYGGLHPYQKGGGNETKSLRLRNTAGREFTLRSINKSRNDVVDPWFKETFIEDIIQDGVSMSYPYAAFAVPFMQEAAGIPHASPVLVYVPQHAALDTFNQRFGNDLYLLEQRPDGDWSSSASLGRFQKFSSTPKVIEKILHDDGNMADQYAFVKVRLFDMLINDWDRHEDNWRWGVADSGDRTSYIPVPRDRDQAFYTKNGIIITRVMQAAGLGFMQNFSYHVKNISMLNVEQRNMDRFFTNKMSLDDWVNAAHELQRSLTDTVISRSVRDLPQEIFNISGHELADKLQSRRDQLEAFAVKYYLFIAKEVDIPGTRKRDYFEISGSGKGEDTVRIFAVNDRRVKSDTPFYKRVFNTSETKEIRVYGIDGEDTYIIKGNLQNTRLRVIGGPGIDSVVQLTGDRIHIYDDRNNRFTLTSARIHVPHDSTSQRFDYEVYNYNVKNVVPYILFNSDDRWYFGLNYSFLRHHWRRVPYANTRTLGLNYYGASRAIVASLSVFYPNLIGKWHLQLFAGYDALKWTNFFGTGNQTMQVSPDRTYYRTRSIEWNGKAGLGRNIGKSSVSFSAYFQATKILNDTSRFIAKVLKEPAEFKPNYYSGLQVMYTYLTLNDSILPTRGFTLSATAGCYRNFTKSDLFQNYSAKMQAYLPLSRSFSFAIRCGFETFVGNSSLVDNAQLYQHAVIGGPANIRGFRAERFWGKSSFYNQNELRYIFNIWSHFINAKAGLLAFFDDGRVWMPNEPSGVLHTSGGGGILIAPFNKVAAAFTYGITKESNLLQLRINTLF